MSDNVLRPRSATELVDASVQLLRTHYQSFAMVSGIGMIPFLIFRPMLLRAIGADGGIQLSGAFSSLLMSIVTQMWYSLAGAAIIAGASQAYHSGELDVGAAITKVLGKIPAILYTSFLKSLAIGFGLILFLVGAGYFYATYFSLPTSVVVEDLTGKQAELRARQLAKDNRWLAFKPLALVLIIYVLILGAGNIASNAIFGGDTTLGTSIVMMVVTILVYPIIPITEMMVYYDLRIRNEGYDVEVMASKLDAQDPTASP